MYGVRLFLASGLSFWVASSALAQEPKVSAKEEKGAIEFFLAGKLATRYLFEAGLAKPVFWPVLAPGDVPVTRAWPLDKTVKGESADHPHQKSFWFCHGDVIPVGQTLREKIKGVEGVDFWSERPGHGVIRQEKYQLEKDRENRIVLKTSNTWAHGETIVLKEDRTITFGPAPQGWMVMTEFKLTASESPVLFADTKEGSLGLRVNDQIRADKMGNGEIRMPGGRKGEKDCWGHKAPWCDYAGSVNGKQVGVTVFASPKNPAPTFWHVRGYGLMAANPFGRKSFPPAKDDSKLIRLEKGESLVLRYAVHVYAGQRDEQEIEKVAKKFWE